MEKQDKQGKGTTQQGPTGPKAVQFQVDIAAVDSEDRPLSLEAQVQIGGEKPRKLRANQRIQVPKGEVVRVTYPETFQTGTRIFRVREEHRHVRCCVKLDTVCKAMYDPVGCVITGTVLREILDECCDEELRTEPVSGPEVVAFLPDGREVARTSVRGGRFSLLVPYEHRQEVLVRLDRWLRGESGDLVLDEHQLRVWLECCEPCDIGTFIYRIQRAWINGRALAGGAGLANVPVTVTSRASGGKLQVQTAVTGAGGCFSAAVLPGRVAVSVPDRVVDPATGRMLETSDGTRTTREQELLGGRTADVGEFAYGEERHIVRWRVRDPEGAPVSGILVEVHQNGVPVAARYTGDDGRVEMELDNAGAYDVVVHRDPRRELGPVTEAVVVNSVVEGETRIAVVAGPAFFATTPHAPGTDEVPSYPVLTEEVSTGGALYSGRTQPAGLARTVSGALRDVLGWRPNVKDSKGFVAALTQSFDCKEAQGRTECVWVPRTYSVQADLGAVTGAQASIYARAQKALDHAVPLLDGLRPLRADSDDEDTASSLEIAKTSARSLGAELGREGGARVQRVDSLFEVLLGRGVATDPARIGGQLGAVRDAYGLDRANVNTIEEEENLTNFLIVVDHVLSLRQSWQAQRSFFARTSTDVYFGTQMVLLSRALAVLAESVDEVQFALDSVFVGSAERQTLELRFPRDREPIFLADLLDWIGTFAAEEAPQMIRDGGKAGVTALIPVMQRLADLTRGALLVQRGGQQNPADVPAGYRTNRVQRAMEELAGHLEDALALSEQVRRAPAPAAVDG
ncbi:MAG: hypothetical protein IPM24_19845 [Bryobacterales bacterium]|nr:hypothetical protein [Bryobacterales bacterium]